MIIIRGTESQSLPNQTGLPSRSYVGEGSALAQAGPQVAAVANNAVYIAGQLDQHYQRLEGVQKGKQIHSDLRSQSIEMLDQWSQDYPNKGAEPKTSIQAVNDWFAKYQASDEFIAARNSDNPYLSQAAVSAFEDVKADTLSKAVPFARTKYIEIGKLRTKTILDTDMQQALEYAAKGDRVGFDNTVSGSMAYVHALKDKLYNAEEITAIEKDYRDNLEERRAYQAVAQAPDDFLTAFNAGQFKRLDPKLAQNLVSIAYSGVAQRAARWDNEHKHEVEETERVSQEAKNGLLARAATDPNGTWALMLNPETRSILGKHYDDTYSVVKAIATDGGVNNIAVMTPLKDAIDNNPMKPNLYKDIEQALINGQIKVDTFNTYSTRLTEKKDSLKDMVKADRHRIIQDEITTRMPQFDVTGIMGQFDTISNWAKSEYRNELQKTLEADTSSKLNPREVSERLFLKYKEYSLGNMISIATKVQQKYGLTDVGQIGKAYQENRISRNESDMVIWLLQQEQEVKPKTDTKAQPKKGRY